MGGLYPIHNTPDRAVASLQSPAQGLRARGLVTVNWLQHSCYNLWSLLQRVTYMLPSSGVSLLSLVHNPLIQSAFVRWGEALCNSPVPKSIQTTSPQRA